LPCHSAKLLPLEFPNVKAMDVEAIWYDSPGFNAFRGDEWMREPCRSCPEKTKDFGGCRCQAYLMTGEATNADPVCDKSLHHEQVLDIVASAQQPEPAQRPLVFRNMANSRKLIGKSRS